MMANKCVIDVVWTGPYAWPKFEITTKLPSIPQHPGVYLMALEYRNMTIEEAVQTLAHTRPHTKVAKELSERIIAPRRTADGRSL